MGMTVDVGTSGQFNTAVAGNGGIANCRTHAPCSSTSGTTSTNVAPAPKLPGGCPNTCRCGAVEHDPFAVRVVATGLTLGATSSTDDVAWPAGTTGETAKGLTSRTATAPQRRQVIQRICRVVVRSNFWPSRLRQDLGPPYLGPIRR